MKSMTGYGKGVSKIGDRQVTVELRSVNGRYLEINSRLPKNYLMCDEVIRKALQKAVKRGTVDVFFGYENTGSERGNLSIDYGLAEKYYEFSKEIEKRYGRGDDFSFSSLVRAPEVVSIEPIKDDPELLLRLVRESAEAAASELDKMRRLEGESIKKDIIAFVASIEVRVLKIETAVPEYQREYRKKLQERITEALDGIAIDESKLLNEVAFFADRSDINEELSRLKSHCGQMRAALYEDDAVGRKMDFLSQEIGREINTIGSKSGNIEITALVLEMKNELEKIKEQIRNIE